MATDNRPRVERALQYICAHLDEPLAAKEVAAVAQLSEFHFHRIFAAEMGESVGRFITRRRLEVAALRIAYRPDLSITEIAHSTQRLRSSADRAQKPSRSRWT